MHQRILGHTDLEVSAIGLDATAFPMPRSRLLRTAAAIDASPAAHTLIAAVDHEINVLDVSGVHEPFEQDYLGHALEPRRRHFTVIGGFQSHWACEPYERRTERLLGILDRLRTNHLDVLSMIVQHDDAVGTEDLLRSDLLDWAEEMIRRGYARFTGISLASSDNAAAFVSSDRFDIMLASYRIVHESLTTQGVSASLLGEARRLGMGVLTNNVPALSVLEQLVQNMSPDVDAREARRIAVSILFELPQVHASLMGVQTPAEISHFCELVPTAASTGAWFEHVDE